MQLFRGKTADRLCNHLRLLGIEAEILQGHPLQKVGASGAKLLGLVQVAGRNIGYVNIIRASMSSQGGTHVEYCLNYLVPLGQIPSSLCRAVLVTKKQGLLRREVVDIEWGGGTLADTLNGDQSLKQSLLMEFRLNGPVEIAIAPEPIYRCTRIETWGITQRGFLPGSDFHLPSGSLFDCLDRIAGHIPPQVTEVNSQPEQVLFEAKVEVNPGSKKAEVASCSVTDRHLRIESREPLQIPLYMVEDCWVWLKYPEVTVRAGTSDSMFNHVVTMRYRDASGRRRTTEFAVMQGSGGDIRDILSNAYPRGITR